MTLLALSMLVLTFFLHRFTATVRVSAAGTNFSGILFRAHRRQLFDQCDQVPNVVVVHALAPSGHAGRLDPVLDDPKRARGILLCVLGQIGRLWIETATELRCHCTR
jgi:hypothetical protein